MTTTPPSDLTTLRYDQSDGVAWITLNRPDKLNSFNEVMVDELQAVWAHVRIDPEVRAVVLTGAGDRSFCTGTDRSEIPTESDFEPLLYEDPGKRLGPKSQGVWKPVIAAVNGMACGGAFYLIGESDIIIASRTATFFDPHVSYGMTAVFEPLLLLPRMSFGEVLRMTLLGNYERISADRALTAGLVSEVVAPEDLLSTAGQIAELIAGQPSTAVQASLRTLWASRDLHPLQASELGNVFLNLGTTPELKQEGARLFESRERPRWRLRDR